MAHSNKPAGQTPPSDRQRRRSLAFAGILVVAAAAVAAYVWTTPLRAERRLRNATLQELRAATQRSPYDPRPFYHLGIRLFALGQPAPAAEALRHAADLESDDRNSWLGAAIASAAAGNLRDGMAIAVTYEQRHPHDAACRLTVAQLCVLQGSVQHALDEAAAATRLEPHNGDAWRTAALQQMRLGKLPGAEQAFQRALRENGNDWRSDMALGTLQSARGQTRAALRYYEAATRAAPSEALPPLLLGKTLLAHASGPAQLEAARQALQQSALLQANNAEINHQLGLYEIQVKDLQAAHNYLERAYGFHPADPAIVSDLLAVDRQRHNAPAVAEDLERQRRIPPAAPAGDPDPASASGPGSSAMPVVSPEPTVLSPDLPDPTLLLRDANALLAGGAIEEARAAYLAILSRNARTAAACEGLGRVMERTGDTEQAFAYYRRAVQINPRLWQSQLALGALYGGSGRFKESAEHFRAGLALVPNDAEGWHAFGMAEANHPIEFQEAEDALKHAVALQPTNVVFIRHLADMQAQRYETRDAEAGYRRALSLAPQDVSTLVALSAFLILHRSTGPALNDAAMFLRSAGSLAPQNAIVWYWQGRLSLQQHDNSQAIRCFLRAAPFLHRKAASELWYNLSRAYVASGQEAQFRAAHARAVQEQMRDHAISVTEDHLAGDPLNAALSLKLAELNLADGDAAQAAANYQRTLRLDPGNEAARKGLAGLPVAVR